MLDLQRLAQTRLMISRLNGIWSPTGQPLCWQVDVYLRPMPLDDVGLLLQAVTAYGCLAYHAGAYAEDYGALPAEWTGKFNWVGEELFFALPEGLKVFEQREFAKLYSKAFVEGFNVDPPPPPPPPRRVSLPESMSANPA